MPVQPKVFVGSAREHIDLLTRLSVLNEYASVRYVPWTNLGVFEYGEYPLHSVMRTFQTVDGAVFFFLGTDKTWWRGQQISTARDNVVFEAGIAVGAFGSTRTAIVTDESTQLPSDLDGLKVIRLALTGNVDNDASDLHAKLQRFFASLTTQDQELRQFWTENEYSIYFHSFDNPERGEFEEIVNVNAVRAAGRLTDYFGKAGIGYTMHSSREPDVPLDRNLVLLGSTASNRVTQRVCDERKVGLPFECSFDEATMDGRSVVRDSGATGYSPEFANGNLAKDYGVLTKIRNPYRPDAWVVIAAGNFGFGTLGAILYALDPLKLAEIPVKTSDSCQVVVELPVFGWLTVGQPKLVDVIQLDDHP